MTFFLTGKGYVLLLIVKNLFQTFDLTSDTKAWFYTNFMPSKIKKNLEVPTFLAYFM